MVKRDSFEYNLSLQVDLIDINRYICAKRIKSMGELKYKYAFDEKGDIVSIDNLTKETSKQHTFKCIVCGSELRPRAIDSKHRRAHFYHKEVVSCNGETYLHKLCKLYVKQYFDNSDNFNISYKISKSCKEYNCNLRNYNCHKEHEINQIDLKKFYDTCTIETTIKGFVADLLLTNSNDTSNPPILIEVCVTHPCEDDKKNSGLKIIEISIKTEKDIECLFSDGILSENLNKRIRNKIEFISFKRDIEEKLTSPISRFIYHPALSHNPFENNIKCDIANNRIFKSSVVELNVVCTKHCFQEDHYSIAYDWLVKHYRIKRCNRCKFYYSKDFDEPAFCRLSKKYGKPKFPEMDYAEKCNSFRESEHLRSYSDNNEYKISNIPNEQANTKEIYSVIIAGSQSFDDYALFEEKCSQTLSEKIKTHNVIILAGTSYRTQNLIQKFSYENNLIVVPYDAEWEKYGRDAGYKSNEKMIKIADALIAFWDGQSKYTEDLIKSAKNNGLKVKVITFSKAVSKILCK